MVQKEVFGGFSLHFLSDLNLVITWGFEYCPAKNAPKTSKDSILRRDVGTFCSPTGSQWGVHVSRYV